MTAMLSTKLFLFLCFVGSVLAQFESICNYDCVQTDVYGPYCGGAACVYSEPDPAQHEQLCSQECADAILGSPMTDCVLSENPNIPNLPAEQRNMVAFIRVFCDNVRAESSMTAPGSAPVSQPFTPSSETPDSAGAPASSIPIDLPESAPPSEETGPSITAEPSFEAESSTSAVPSVAAEPSISGEPSVAAEPSISGEPSIAAESFAGVEPSLAAESFVAAEPFVGALIPEPIDSPEAMGPAIAYISGVSPEEGLYEDDDGDVLEALDL